MTTAKRPVLLSLSLVASLVAALFLGFLAFIFALVVGLTVADPCCFPSSHAQAVTFATRFGLAVALAYLALNVIMVIGECINLAYRHRSHP